MQAKVGGFLLGRQNIILNFILKPNLIMLSEKYINRQETLDFEQIYHVYNRAVGTDKLFITERDYYYFQEKFDRYLSAFVEIFSFCLLPNHFHFLLRIKEKSKIIEELNYKGDDFSYKNTNRAFSNFFNSYTKSFNKVHHRKGKLLMLPYKRILVDEEDYLLTLINYIHRNPIHHGLKQEFAEWKYSSYNDYICDRPSKIKKAEIILLFGTIENFIQFHQENKVKPEIKKHYLE